MQRTIWTIIKEGHIRIIPAKFGQILTSSLGGEEMSFKSIVNGRTDDDRWRTKTDHKSSPCHYVKGELKMFILTFVYPIIR